MSIWFTSDLHFGHVNILTYTPQRRTYLNLEGREVNGEIVYPDVNDMNEALVQLWNRQVAPDDTVFVIGDVAMGRVNETIEYVRRLNGEKFLVPGNHDRVHPIMFKNAEKAAEWDRLYADVGFNNLGEGPHRGWNFGGVTADVSHFPYEGDHSEEERYGEWRPLDWGRPLVHGHVHDEWKTNGRMYNVGIDAWDGVFQTAEAIGAYFRSKGYTA